MEQLTIGKMALWLLGVIPAILGALLSIIIRKEPVQFKHPQLAKIEPVITFLFGVSIAYFFGGACIEYLHIPAESFAADSIKFSVGLFGMGAFIQGMTQLPLVASALRKKFLGE